MPGGWGAVAQTLGAEFRLLITGSRHWEHPGSVERVLRFYLRQAVHNGHRLVVTQGKAYRGADATADAWAEHAVRCGWAVTNDPHPADWSRCSSEWCTPGHQARRPSGRMYCPRAGHARNQVMVDTRPHAWVAFWRAGSSGTKDCRARATAANIPGLTIVWGQRHDVTEQWLIDRAPLAHLTLVGGSVA